MRRLAEFAAGIALAWAAAQASSTGAPPALGLPVVPGAPRDAQPIGAAFDTDAALPAHADPVASYTLRASLDTVHHTVHGEGTIVFRNASRAPLRELFVHLYLNGFKNDRTLFMRVPVDGFRGTGASSAAGRIDVKRFAVREMGGDDLWPKADATSPGDPDDETDIRVPLPRALEPGAILTADLAWDATLPALTFRTGWFGAFHMVGQWFPKLARLEPDGRFTHFAFHHLSEFYADFGAYDVTLDTPDNVVVGATGKLESEVRAAGRIERRFTQQDVHDFAFTAWDGFRERTAQGPSGTTIRCLYPQGHERDAEVEIESVQFGLRYFGDAFGRYPYDTLTLVHPPDGAEEAGGMEYPTLITTGGLWFLPWTGVRILETVTLHELGHQWFYGLVATDEHAWPFLDEGVNSYAEADALEARFPHASAIGAGRLAIDMPAVNRAGSADRAANAPVAQPAPAFMSGGDYGALVYRRTATIFATLAGVYGADPVRRAVGRYARRFRFEHPGPDALLAAVAEVVGSDAADALRTALFDRGTVDYLVESFESELRTSPGAGGSASAGASTQTATWSGTALVRRRGTLRFPVDVDMVGDDGSVQHVRWDARDSAARLPYAGTSKLIAVVVDPAHHVLLDDNLANNVSSARSSPLGAASLERGLFAVELGLTGLLP